jgi:hypothetical protein
MDGLRDQSLEGRVRAGGWDFAYGKEENGNANSDAITS